jgi:hypothetical protein
VLGFAATFALEFSAQRELRQAADRQGVLAGLESLRLVSAIGGLSLLTVLATGITLTSTVWGWRTDWISVGFATLIVIAVVGALTNGPTTKRLREGAMPSPSALGLLRSSLILRAALIASIVFIMTFKPPLLDALTGVGVAVVASLLLAFALRMRRS